MGVKKLGFIGPLSLLLVAGCEDGKEINVSSSTLNQIQEDYEEGELESNIYDYESRFSQNNYAGDLDADNQVAFEKGSKESEILISAPHTTTHIRDQKVRDAEVYTGSIALLVQAYTGAHVMYNVHEGEDANYERGGEYKNHLGDVIETYDIDLVIDLHGAKEKQGFDVDIGTNHGETVSDDRVNGLKEAFSYNNVSRVNVNESFPAAGSETITNHTYNHYDTEAMQLEINYNYRNPREDMDAYIQMLQSLVLFVEHEQKGEYSYQV